MCATACYYRCLGTYTYHVSDCVDAITYVTAMPSAKKDHMTEKVSDATLPGLDALSGESKFLRPSEHTMRLKRQAIACVAQAGR